MDEDMQEGDSDDDLDLGSTQDVAPPTAAQLQYAINTARQQATIIRDMLLERSKMEKTIAQLQEEVKSLRQTIEGNDKKPAATITTSTAAPQTKTPIRTPSETPVAPKAKRVKTSKCSPANNSPSARPPPTPVPTPPPTPQPTFIATPATFTTTIPTAKPNDTIPPIILHDKESWTLVSSALNSQKITYTRATNTREGIRITPASINDYKSISALLSKESLSFHSFQLPSEKNIKVVIRGVPQYLSESQILFDLANQNYIPIRVSRLNGRNNRPAPLILLQLERKFKSIFNLKTLCGLDITVEAKRIPSGPLQCHRCQRFGHTQPNCHAPYRCLKCAEPHSTHLCEKPPTTPAVCANCNSSHVSSHHSCPSNPNNLKKSYASLLKPASTPKPQSTTESPPPRPQATTPTSFASLAVQLFQALLATNPTVERIAAFTNQISLLRQTFSQ